MPGGATGECCTMAVWLQVDGQPDGPSCRSAVSAAADAAARHRWVLSTE